MRRRKNRWQCVIDRELSLRGIDLTGKSALPAANTAHSSGLSERDCIVKLGMEGHHPMAVREAMKKAGYFKSSNKKSATSLVYWTFNYHKIGFTLLDDMEVNKKLPRGAVMYRGKVYAGIERVEMMRRLAEFLQKPLRLSYEDVHARVRDPMEKAG